MPLLQDTPSVDLFLWPFSATKPRVVKPVCLPLQTKQRQTIPFYYNVPPEEHLQPQAMHAWQWRLQDFHTAVGKPTFPLFVAPPLIHPHGAARQYICPFSFPPLYAYASVSMPPSRTASGVIFVAWGKGKDGIRNSNFLSKNLHALSGVVFV